MRYQTQSRRDSRHKPLQDEVPDTGLDADKLSDVGLDVVPEGVPDALPGPCTGSKPVQDEVPGTGPYAEKVPKVGPPCSPGTGPYVELRVHIFASIRKD